MDWLNLAAMAVNEQNASGGRIVTAPTNGAAGIVPAVLLYALHYLPDLPSDGGRACVDYLLTAAAVGDPVQAPRLDLRRRGGLPGRGRVGLLDGGRRAHRAARRHRRRRSRTPPRSRIEHNLGLTCDPVGGLVQIPCIERNAVGAVKAVNAASLAMHGDGTHHVSLDQAIETMRQTGRDMLDKYKETSTGGLAVNVVEC